MSIPKKYYYYEKQSAPVYGNTPSRRFSVERCIAGKPYWLQPKDKSVTKQKTLVLADWTAANWTPEKIEAVQSRMTELIKAGFTIYAWQGEHFQPVTLDSLYLLSYKSFREKMHLDYPATINDALIKQHNVTKDQIHILDDYGVQCLLSQNENQERVLDPQDLIALRKQNVAPRDACEILKSANPKINAIRISELRRTAKEFNTVLSSYFPDIPTEINYTSLQHTPEIEARTIINKLTPNDLSGIERYSSKFKKGNNALMLEYLLGKGCELKSIKLEDGSCQNLATDAAANPGLATMQELIISRTTCADNVVTQLLAQTSSLKTLEFRHAKGMKNLDTSGINYQSLQRFIAHNSKIPDRIISNILRDANRLKYLSLESESDKANNILQNVRLPMLETLNLDFVCIDKKSLSEFLNQPNRLKSISISAGNGAESLDIHPTSFPVLHDLSLIASIISEVDVLDFLANSATLKSIDLRNSIFVKDKRPDLEALEHQQYPALQNLNLLGCNLSAATLHHIISSASNLQSLDISNDLISALYLYNPRITLPTLKTLALDMSDSDKQPGIISIQSLFIVFETGNLAQLTELNLTNAIGMNSVIMPEFMGKLPSLKKITLTQCDLDDDALISLLPLAPNLTTIHLTKCRDVQMSARLQAILQERKITVTGVAFKEPETQAAPESRQAESQKTLDADTRAKPDLSYNVPRIFYAANRGEPPIINYYRLDVFNEIGITEKECQLANAFTLSRTGDLDLIPCNITKTFEDVFAIAANSINTADEKYYYGKQDLEISGNWQAIASLSPNETLTHFHVTPDADVEIQYSQRDNLYYIRNRSGEPARINIDFILSVPTMKHTLPLDIESMVSAYNLFGPGELKVDKKNPSGEDYLRYITNQTVGACRHRSLAFKAQMERDHRDIPVRIIESDCHSFVEIKVGSNWVTRCLGGYDAKLTIQEAHTPLKKPGEPAITQASLLQNTEEIQQFSRQLRTWESDAKPLQDPRSYVMQLVNGEHKKQLIQLDSGEDIQTLRLSLQSHCQSISRPVYYINSPDDLVCEAPFITRVGDKGIINKGPGGPLYDFLQSNRDPGNPPVIIVNYDRFDADDLVRFNSLLDNKRKADGTAVPESAIIIGLMNPNKPDCYQGGDFYSRFDHKEVCHAKLPLPPAIFQKDVDVADTDSVTINLHHADDWQDSLLGKWQLHGDSITFVEGKLDAALKKGKPIIIQNGLWEDAAFQEFWQAAKTLGVIKHAGREITIPDDSIFLQKDGYDWHNLKPALAFSAELQHEGFILNASSYNELFQQYHCQDEKLFPLPGLIANATKTKEKILSVNLSRDLNEDAWAALLLECQSHGVQLKCHVMHDVTLPPALTPEKMPLASAPVRLPDHTRIYATNDIDACVAQQKSNGKEWLVLDISECSASDLIKRINSEFNRESLLFKFSETEQALITALKSNQNIILKGQFSTELLDALTPLLMARTQNPEIKNEWILVSSPATTLNHFKVTEAIITPQQKRAILTKEYTDTRSQRMIDDFLTITPEEPLCHLRAKLINQDPWRGMHTLTSPHRSHQFNPEQSAAISSEFNRNRLNDVNNVLQYSPFVFIAGLTGVGKSTFVEKILGQQANNKVHFGEDKMAEWANDKDQTTQKILFIDEANITNKEWSEFEGLFNKPPGILINGEYHQLTDKHKVVFAGNPLSYGDERKLPQLFARHGGAVVFDPMPQEMIYQEIIKPVFENTILQKYSQPIAEKLLAIYQFLCDCSRDEVLISPREVQMMAVLILSNQLKHPDCDPLQAADDFAWLIAKHLAPADAAARFSQQFQPASKLPVDATILEDDTSKFLVTPSRHAVSQQLKDILDLREFRCSKNATHDSQRYGGLGGIVIEGEPGIGKSELVRAVLKAQGYKKVRPGQEVPEKPYYKLAMSMQTSEKEALLLKAFHEGAVVFIDELNSAPMMEKLMNDLLMGKAPGGVKPDKPGFLIISTQNPVTMAGRRKSSTALSRRTTTVTLPPYTSDEMEKILRKAGCGARAAKNLVAAYEYNRAYAHEHQLTPPPTFRDLLKVAKNEIRRASLLEREELLNMPELTSSPVPTRRELCPKLHLDPALSLFGGKDRQPKDAAILTHLTVSPRSK